MPQKVWAVGEEVLAADFNTYVQQQTVPAFPNTATRDTQWTSPPNGAVCVTTDTYTLWMRQAGAWVVFTAPPTPWTTLPMQNSWVAYDANYTQKYRKVGDVVDLRGMMKNGTINTAAFNIPVGFRPFKPEETFVASSASAFAQISVDSSGIGTPKVGNTANFYLSG